MIPGLPDRPPRGPEGYKALADLLGVRRADSLLVMSRNYDPFFKGTPAHWRNARWFADLWERFGFSDGAHLRRMHYRIISIPNPRNAAGQPYENNEKCFSDLCVAGTAARTLGLIDPEAFDDRRNPAARLHVSPREDVSAPEWSVDEPEWVLPEIASWMLGAQANYRLPGVEIDGYDYHPDDQPVMVEVWIEKTTMDDILVPLCQEQHLNLVRAAGFESITAIVGLLRRAERHQKPAHVLYVSDFDPAGERMPVAVARQVQFWREQLGIDVELSIEQVALTADQVAAYHLPAVPIKDSDRRKASFEARNGEGAVELDALEALHPGKFAEAVSHAIQPYVDLDLERRIDGARWDAKAQASRQWRNVTADLRSDLAGLEADVRGVVGRYRERLATLGEELAADLEPYRERLDSLRGEAERLADETEIELPERPAPAEVDVDRSKLLFDSRRHWWEQHQVFKRWQGKRTEP